MSEFAAKRARMVERQLRRRGITDERVLKAMGEVPREAFVGHRLRRRAYDDGALPIGEGQTISQPWVVAAICQGLALRGTETVLEVGTGSGYSAAVLARLAKRVIGIERIPELALDARERLERIGARGIEVRIGDGTLGAPEDAPFDAIAVHASAPRLPLALFGQLAVGGRMVIPIAEGGADNLTVFIRTGSEVDLESGAGVDWAVIAPCRFVPLIGEGGFDAP